MQGNICLLGSRQMKTLKFLPEHCLLTRNAVKQEWIRRQDFLHTFSSGHVPVHIPCPILGDPVDLLSRPPPSAELGCRQRQNERWPRQLLRTPRVNWLFLSSLCLGEEGIEFLKLFVALLSCPLNPAALIQTLV